MQEIAHRKQMQPGPQSYMPQHAPMYTPPAQSQQGYHIDNRCAPGTVGGPRHPPGRPPTVYSDTPTAYGDASISMDGYRQFETEMRLCPNEVPRCFKVMFDTGGYQPLASTYAPEARWKNNMDYLNHIKKLTQRCEVFGNYLQKQRELYTAEGLRAWKERREIENLLQLKVPSRSNTPATQQPTLESAFNRIWKCKPTEEVKQALHTVAKHIAADVDYIEEQNTQDHDDSWLAACDDYQTKLHDGELDTEDELMCPAAAAAPSTPEEVDITPQWLPPQQQDNIVDMSPIEPRCFSWADEEIIPQLPAEVMRDIPTDEGKRRRVSGKQTRPDQPAPETPPVKPAASKPSDDSDDQPPVKPKVKPQAARAASAARTAGSARITKVRK